ncbi:MAG: hypothetical protein N2F24_18920, partial [Deltaproteobacteria bacterium]
IGGGRRAAATIHKIMNHIELSLPDNVLNSRSVIQNVDQLEQVSASSRTIMPQATPRELSAAVEIEKGFTKEMADAESRRCLQCGLICYEHTGPVPAPGEELVPEALSIQ